MFAIAGFPQDILLIVTKLCSLQTTNPQDTIGIRQRKPGKYIFFNKHIVQIKTEKRTQRNENGCT